MGDDCTRQPRISTDTSEARERVCDDGSSVVPKDCYYSNDFTPVGKRASSGGKVLTVYCNVQGKNKDTSSLGGNSVQESSRPGCVGRKKKKKAEVLILCVAANREVD